MTKLAGHFHLRVVDKDTGVVTKEASFGNLVTNLGLRRYAQRGAGPYTIVVGTGTATPTVEDTTLANLIATSPTANFNPLRSNGADGLYSFTSTFSVRFAAGRIANTISEIGLMAGDVLWSRQLILDERGDPSTITVLQNEYLDVTYSMTVYPNLDDIQFSFEMNGITYTCVSRHAMGASISPINGFSVSSPVVNLRKVYSTQTLGSIASEPAGTSVSGTTTCTFLSWDASTPYTSRYTITMGQGSYNVAGGVGSLLLGFSSSTAFYRQISFDPVLPKNNSTIITLTFSETVSRYSST